MEHHLVPYYTLYHTHVQPDNRYSTQDTTLRRFCFEGLTYWCLNVMRPTFININENTYETNNNYLRLFDIARSAIAWSAGVGWLNLAAMCRSFTQNTKRSLNISNQPKLSSTISCLKNLLCHVWRVIASTYMHKENDLRSK